MSNKPRMKHSDKLKKCCDFASLPLLHRLKLYENGAHSETTMGQSQHTHSCCTMRRVINR